MECSQLTLLLKDPFNWQAKVEGTYSINVAMSFTWLQMHETTYLHAWDYPHAVKCVHVGIES